jgi:hypothetical protein
VQLNGPPGDGQTEAGTSVRVGGAAAGEPFKSVRPVMARDAWPLVGDFEQQAARRSQRPGGNGDGSVRRAVDGGIVEQIRDDLMQPVPVAVHAEPVLHIDPEAGAG